MSIEYSHILVAYKQNIMSHGLISPHQSDCSSGTLIVLHTYHINIIIVCSIRQIAHIIMLINQIQAWHGLIGTCHRMGFSHSLPDPLPPERIGLGRRPPQPFEPGMWPICLSHVTSELFEREDS